MGLPKNTKMDIEAINKNDQIINPNFKNFLLIIKIRKNNKKTQTMVIGRLRLINPIVQFIWWSSSPRQGITEFIERKFNNKIVAKRMMNQKKSNNFIFIFISPADEIDQRQPPNNVPNNRNTLPDSVCGNTQ
jgi:hypothetical protein